MTGAGPHIVPDSPAVAVRPTSLSPRRDLSNPTEILPAPPGGCGLVATQGDFP